MGIGNGREFFDSFGDAIRKDITLSEVSNEGIRNVGVDATGWLMATKWQAEQNKKLHMDCFKEYAKTRIELLKLHRFVPTLVFDGNATPVKTYIKELKAAIINNKDKDKKDKKDIKVIYKKPLARHIPERSATLDWLRQDMKVDCLVAPYESDAQLAFLENKKIIDVVLTEDSDLIAFGCKKIIYKLNAENGTCQYYSLDQVKKNPLYKNFTSKMILEMSILMGCDYFPKLVDFGITTARAKILKYQSFENLIGSEVLKLRMEKEVTDTSIIMEQFHNAILAFTYQQVYNPMSRKCENLCIMDYKLEEICTPKHMSRVIGPKLKDQCAYLIAQGDRPSDLDANDFLTKKRFKDLTDETDEITKPSGGVDWTTYRSIGKSRGNGLITDYFKAPKKARDECKEEDKKLGGM